MYKTLRISFSLRNTYRVNTILYALKQIPFLKRLLPESLYGGKRIKDIHKCDFHIMGNLICFSWETILFYHIGVRNRDFISVCSCR